MLKYSLDKLVNMILNIATAVITAYLLSKMPTAEPELATKLIYAMALECSVTQLLA